MHIQKRPGKPYFSHLRQQKGPRTVYDHEFHIDIYTPRQTVRQTDRHMRIHTYAHIVLQTDGLGSRQLLAKGLHVRIDLAAPLYKREWWKYVCLRVVLWFLCASTLSLHTCIHYYYYFFLYNTHTHTHTHTVVILLIGSFHSPQHHCCPECTL